jgi:hypothetical protein
MHMTRDQLLQQQASARVVQEKYDSALAPWGSRADAKPLAHDLDDYRRDLAVRVKKLLPEDHELRKVQFRRLPADAFEQFEPQLLAASRDCAWRPDAVPRGQIERREKTDSNGFKAVHWLGSHSFVRDLPCHRPGRRVTSFRTDQGYIDASGRPLR